MDNITENFRFIESNEEVRVTRSGRPMMSEERTEVREVALTKAEKKYYENIKVDALTSNY